MKGLLVLQGSDPKVEKTVTFHAGGGTVCLEKPGVWELIPDRQTFRLSQRSFSIDTSVPNEIDLSPSFINLPGQLQFDEQKTIDEQLDDIGLRLNGKEFWEFEDMDESKSNSLARDFSVWVPYELIRESSNLEIEVISNRPDSNMLFNPRSKHVAIDVKELGKNFDLVFHIKEGMFVKGQTKPAVSGVEVLIKQAASGSLEKTTFRT